MSVGNHYSPDIFTLIQEIINIGNDKVDSQHFLLREHEPGIDDENIICIFQHHHILSDFA